MKSKIISVDLAKDVFEVAVANSRYRILERRRLSRKEFSGIAKLTLVDKFVSVATRIQATTASSQDTNARRLNSRK